jgi:hypothetical protein
MKDIEQMARSLPKKPNLLFFTRAAKWLMLNLVFFNGARSQAAELLDNITFAQRQRIRVIADHEIQERISHSNS